ncbi:hypothetical protein [uncultured Aquimarina sp.]|uniref:hypothetical protein n=1 Tax=uncultured Aquimarina sp. TaxID=575652 RepID=UPI0026163208|nr:hypothetical protein [uncultured Aquimarina sp.]
MKKSHIKKKLTLEKMNIAKLNNLSSIRGGSIINMMDSINSLNNEDDDNDDSSTIDTWGG